MTKGLGVAKKHSRVFRTCVKLKLMRNKFFYRRLAAVLVLTCGLVAVGYVNCGGEILQKNRNGLGRDSKRFDAFGIEIDCQKEYNSAPVPPEVRFSPESMTLKVNEVGTFTLLNAKTFQNLLLSLGDTNPTTGEENEAIFEEIHEDAVSVQHSYSSPGTYNVAFQAVDWCDVGRVAYITITVTP